MQPREPESAAAGVRLDLAGQVAGRDATAGGVEPGVEPGGDLDGVFRLVAVPEAKEPMERLLDLRMGPNGDGVSFLNENDGILGEEFLLLLLAAAGDFPPHVDGDGIGGVGAGVNGAEVNVHDERAAG